MMLSWRPTFTFAHGRADTAGRVPVHALLIVLTVPMIQSDQGPPVEWGLASNDA